MTTLDMMDKRLEAMLLRDEIAQFLYHEAELLDNREFTAWLDLLADDVTYFMPIRRNVKFGEHAEHENTEQGVGISWFDEDKWTLAKRVDQIMTGDHYAEEPLSRVCRLVTNVQVENAGAMLAEGDLLKVASRFLLYQNRGQYETMLFVGKRYDQLRRTATTWQLASRKIILEQNVLLARNLTVLF